MRISVVIPTLNEELAVERTICAAKRISFVGEVIVADGGSSDGTQALAEQAGARVIPCQKGRGIQLQCGASEASGDVLWFLHADTVAPIEAGEAMQSALARPDVVAGNFALQFDGESAGARHLTRIYPHLRKLGLCYGDSGIFVRRRAYEAIGGFSPYPLFEDLDLVRRLRRIGGFEHLQCRLVTSSRRFETRNFAGVFTYWSALQVLYWAGVSPVTLGKWYAPVRGASGSGKPA